jgi:hypothetical protein
MCSFLYSSFFCLFFFEKMSSLVEDDVHDHDNDHDDDDDDDDEQVDEPEPQEQLRNQRKRARTASSTPPHALSRVNFSPAEWRSFQRCAIGLSSVVRSPVSAAASGSASSSASVTADVLLASIASATNETHAVFEAAMIQKVLYAIGAEEKHSSGGVQCGGFILNGFLFVVGDFVMLKHDLSPNESLPRDRLVVGLVRCWCI